MVVFGAGINLEVLEDSFAQTGLGEHTANGLLDDELGLFLQVIGCRGETLSARIAGVASVDLVGQFFACQLHLFGIDDDDIVTAVGVGRVARLVLAAQNLGDLRRKATQHLVGGVDDVPLLGDGSCVRRDGFVA